jgi:hypothetical protein
MGPVGGAAAAASPDGIMMDSSSSRGSGASAQRGKNLRLEEGGIGPVRHAIQDDVIIVRLLSRWWVQI